MKMHLYTRIKYPRITFRICKEYFQSLYYIVLKYPLYAVNTEFENFFLFGFQKVADIFMSKVTTFNNSCNCVTFCSHRSQFLARKRKTLLSRYKSYFHFSNKQHKICDFPVMNGCEIQKAVRYRTLCIRFEMPVPGMWFGEG